MDLDTLEDSSKEVYAKDTKIVSGRRELSCFTWTATWPGLLHAGMQHLTDVVHVAAICVQLLCAPLF